MKSHLTALFSLFLLLSSAGAGGAPPAPVPSAVFDVEPASPSLKDRTAQFSALLFAALANQKGLALVERSQLDVTLGELSMGASGLADAGSAGRLGRLTGAKVLVLARTVGTTSNMTVVAKVIGAETGRVFAASQVVGPGDIQSAADGLADEIAKVVTSRAGDLLAPADAGAARETRLRALVAGKTLRAVTLAIPEVHLTRPVRDPAAQTELSRILIGLGFPVFDAEAADKAAIRITGEAFSEQGGRHGDFVSCRARVEVKVVEVATGRVLIQDAQTEVAADLSEAVAGKTALQQAAAKLADRIVPALVF